MSDSEDLLRRKVLCERRVPEKIWSARIVQNKPLAKNQWILWVKLEEGSFPQFELGNFCMISIPDQIDTVVPRPFAIAEAREGMYAFIYRITGKLTKMLASLPVGVRLDVTGPLGRGISRDHLAKGHHVFIAGGVGYASLLPLIENLGERATGDVYYGVREELEVIRKGKLKPHFASDDGSIGLRGRLPELIKGAKFPADSWFYVCGPSGMMKAVFKILPQERSLYFLEETMGCGFGICVGCVVSIDTAAGLSNKKSCLEGCMFLGENLKTWAAASGGHS